MARWWLFNVFLSRFLFSMADFLVVSVAFLISKIKQPGRVDGQQAEGVTPRPLHSPRNPSQEGSASLPGKIAPRRKGLPAPDTTAASSVMRLLFSIPDSLPLLLNGSSISFYQQLLFTRRDIALSSLNAQTERLNRLSKSKMHHG